MLRKRLLIKILLSALAATSAWSQQNPQSGPDHQSAGIQTPAASGGQAASSSQHSPGMHHKRGARPNSPSATNPANIPYNGGKVIPHPPVYAFWWENPSDFAPDVHDGINHFLKVLDGSAYMDLPNQYLFGNEANIAFRGNIYDYSAPPTQDPPTTEVVAEVCSVLEANGMKPDPTAIYAVYLSSSSAPFSYCAYHDHDSCPNGTNIHVMWVPNQNNDPACWVQPPELTCNGKSNGLQAAANSTAHELMESITDPNGDAWVDLTGNVGNEIGDPCNFTYKRCVNLSDGSKWQLQEIWSNKVSACVQGTGSSDQ
jgi:hypothetical protein